MKTYIKLKGHLNNIIDKPNLACYNKLVNDTVEIKTTMSS